VPRRWKVRIGAPVTQHTRDVSSGLGVVDSAVIAGEGWPWPQSTAEVGVESGASLTTWPGPGQYWAGTAGMTVENLIINTDLLIRANNVTVRNCRIVGGKINTGGNTGDPSQVYSGTLIEHVEIDGNNGAQEMGLDGSNATCRWVWIHGTSNGFRFFGNNTVEDSVVDGLVVPEPSAHVSGMGMNGGSGVTVRRCVIAARTVPQASASLVFYAQDYSRNVTLEDNLIIGGGYAAYLGWDSVLDDAAHEPQNIVVRRNRWSREHYTLCGFNGAARAWNTNKPGHVWSDNYFADPAGTGGIYNVVDGPLYADPVVVG
jgi:hypothetical protein